METLMETENIVSIDRPRANMSKDHIPGWGMDADPENDPTYPMKKWNGADHERLNYEKAPQQPVEMEVLKSIERPTITRVFGTSTPPKGLSGMIRRYAYKFSEANAAHWMVLILADRVNVIEGIIDDLRKGIVPNLFIEKGWRGEWKYNKKGFIKKTAVMVGIAAAIMIYLNQKEQKRQKKKGVFTKLLSSR